MSQSNLRQIVMMNREVLRRHASKDLLAFVEQAWTVLEPGTPFQRTWHVKLLCEHLQAVTSGQTRQLVINIPPRYGKSLLVSVFWPVWEWIQHPSRRWLFASYSEALSTKHSIDRRRLIESPWYREAYGQVVRLASDQRTKTDYHNTRRGSMIATSLAGSITGKGGNRLVIDDPHSPDQADSDIQRDRGVQRYRQTFATRLNDKKSDATVLVMQRLHCEDLTAICLDLGFEHVCLPAIARTKTTIVFPISGRQKVREEDETLWPEKESLADLEALQRTMGRPAFEGQYQQSPVLPGGAIFDRSWWSWYHEAPDEGQILQSWDLTFTGDSNSDYVVGLVALRKGALVYILDRFKAKVSFVETCRAIETMVEKYPRTSVVLVEQAANGSAVIDTLIQKVRGLTAVKPKGGKSVRAWAVSPWVSSGQILLPKRHAPDGELRSDRRWVDDFVETCAIFPKGGHDDDVDAFTQLLVYCMEHQDVAPAGVWGKREPLIQVRNPMWGEFPRRNPGRTRLTEAFGLRRFPIGLDG